MKYRIIGSNFPAVEIVFEQPGESMFTQSGGMAWMTEGIQMDSNMKGGIGKSLGRLFSGESLFMATYRALAPNTSIAFSSVVPGEILPIELHGNAMIAQKGAFLAAQESVSLRAVFTKRFSSGLFGGEGFVLQELSGDGLVFLEVDGNSIERVLAPGEVLKVDSGNVVAFDQSVSYEIETVKGLKNVFFGGEGLFLTRLTGPGRVILQTQNFNDMASKIIAMVPSSGA